MNALDLHLSRPMRHPEFIRYARRLNSPPFWPNEWAALQARTEGQIAVPITCLLPADFTTLENPGNRSEQMVWPENAPDARVSITRVTMEPGAISPRHWHREAEQTWLVERGCGLLLLADGGSEEVGAGEVIITPPGEVQGVANIGKKVFVYVSVTTPLRISRVPYKHRL
jgi:quercetin dioxygenase-like cupin family protein